MSHAISSLDLVIVGLYFCLVFFIAWRVTVKERSKTSGAVDSEDYFLAGKNLGWFVIGASLFASNIGSEHLVGLAGSGARGDMVAAQFEILAAFMLIILGWIFVPFYLKSGVFTMPEFLERRYSSGARNYLSIISILAYILTKISVTIFAGALVFEVLGVSFWAGAVLVVLATGLYTIFGGLRAVIYADMIQMFVFLIGAVSITFYGLEILGGWDGMMDTLQLASSADPQLETTRFFNLWRPASDPDFPWTGILFGAPILGVWYWCTDQFIVQRVLSARNISQARKGSLFGGFLKLTPLFLFLIPGIIAFALAQKGVISLHGDPDKALPAMITGFLPSGIRGLVLAGLLAALMSSLSSVFNSCSTLFTIDFYKKWRPKASESSLVMVGRLATVLLVVLSLAWIPFMKAMMEGSSFYRYLQSVQAYISPPIAAVFLLGLFHRRINARGALAALWVGFGLGVSRLLLEFLSNTGSINLEGQVFLHWLVTMNFLHFAIFLFLISILVMILMSMTAPAPDDTSLENLIFRRGDTRDDPDMRKDLVWTAVLILLILAIWIWFSPLGIAG